MRNSSGQALLLVLLGVATILTFAMSSVSRSISEVSVTSREGESLRAFSAAEAGIEDILVSAVTPGINISKDVDEAASYSADISNFPNASANYLYPYNIPSGEVATLWLVDHKSDGTINHGSGFTGNSVEVCFGNEGTANGQSTTPAIDVSVLYDDGEYKVARSAFDPSSSRRTVNNFSSVDQFSTAGAAKCSFGEDKLAARTNINFGSLGIPQATMDAPGGIKYVSVRMLYNSDESHGIAFISGGANFPSQGKEINSTGTSGEALRKVEVFTLYPAVPPIFDSALFSPVDIAK